MTLDGKAPLSAAGEERMVEHSDDRVSRLYYMAFIFKFALI